VVGGLSLAQWRGRVRLAGLAPVAAASLIAANTPIPDLLVTGDGRQVGITVPGPDGTARQLTLRDSRSSYTRDNIMEFAGVGAEPVPLADWRGERCSSAFCTVTLKRGGRALALLLGRGRDQVEERALAAACAEADIVVSERFLPRSCRPRWLKADRRYLERSGGFAIDLTRGRIVTVAEGQGAHGWWRAPEPCVGFRPPRPQTDANPVQNRNQPPAGSLRLGDDMGTTRHRQRMPMPPRQPHISGTEFHLSGPEAVHRHLGADQSSRPLTRFRTGVAQ